MAVRQRPRGSVVRTPPDWFARNLVGAYATNGPCVGNLTGIWVYNNASDGSVLRIYQVTIQGSANFSVFFKLLQGNSGPLFTGVGAPNPIDPRTPSQWGQLYTTAQATGLGIAIGGQTTLSSSPFTFSPGFPIAIIPPGYSFGVESNVTNVTLFTGFSWLSAYE